MKGHGGREIKKLGKKGYVLFALLRPWNQKKHFILECDAFRDIRENYHSMLASILWHCLFSDGTVIRLGQLITNLSKKGIVLQKEKNKEVGGPID